MSQEEQVGGHAGGILFFPETNSLAKASEPTEIAFYTQTEKIRQLEQLAVEETSDLKKKKDHKALLEFTKFIPKYSGLHSNDDPPFIKIADACAGLTKPCVADLKIGSKLYEDTATPLKKSKMAAYASATTANQFGVLISGLKVFDPETNSFLKFPKKYGYSITAHTIPLGIRQFFVDARGKFVHRHHIPVMIKQLKVLRDSVEKCEGLQLISSSILLIYDGAKLDGIYDGSPNTDQVKVIDFNHSYYDAPDGSNVVDDNYLHGIISLIKILEVVYTMPFSPPPKRTRGPPNEEQLKNKADWDKWWAHEDTIQVLQITNPNGVKTSGAGSKRAFVAGKIAGIGQTISAAVPQQPTSTNSFPPLLPSSSSSSKTSTGESGGDSVVAPNVATSNFLMWWKRSQTHEPGEIVDLEKKKPVPASRVNTT